MCARYETIACQSWVAAGVSAAVGPAGPRFAAFVTWKEIFRDDPWVFERGRCL
jgi:hypothetical protein